ncbi:hypothetical protein CLD_2357 [Clostridium botulinum B1 str. Okra]|uniref:Uncharacterized protein n=1 Tax=Clostridium botulinum (strain Okra / Type B1) TaxID=498213 RepID=B1IGX0_CLOBK|nr:hypothetical protein CLD_2357 [Clostridium botulinum B1 str. Okra]
MVPLATRILKFKYEYFKSKLLYKKPFKVQNKIDIALCRY